MLELLVLFAALQVLDIWTTYTALKLGGSELNPVMRWIMSRFGVLPALLFMKIVVVALAYKYIYPVPDLAWVLGAVSAFYAYVVYNNIKAIKTLKTRG